MTAFTDLAAILREVGATLPKDYPGSPAISIPSDYEADRATRQLWDRCQKMADRDYAAGELLVGLAGTAAALAACLPPHARLSAAQLLRLAANAVEPVERRPA